jgi:hypothetical protein
MGLVCSRAVIVGVEDRLAAHGVATAFMWGLCLCHKHNPFAFYTMQSAHLGGFLIWC